MVKRWEAFFYLTRQLIKLATKSLLRSPNKSTDPGDNFLNHDIADVVEKALHITSFEHPWSDIRLLYEFR